MSTFNPEDSKYAFTGIPTFMRADHVSVQELESRQPSIVVMGVPFDEGAPFMPGSRFGPRSIREHSLRFSKNGIYDFKNQRIVLADELQKNRMVDVGDATIIPTDIEGSIGRVSAIVSEVMKQGSLLITLGGDHSITYPVVRAIERPHHVVLFDAHADYLPIHPGFEYTNSHAFTHINNMEHVKSLTTIGYRSIRELSGLDCAADGNRVIGMDEFRELGPEKVVECVPEGEPVYVTIDIDVLDSSLIPGCVSAEPDGFQYRELRDSLATLAKRNEIIGFEIVEVSPQLDVGTGITSYLAAHILIEFLGQIVEQDWWKERHP